jgi:capsular exopolysaccharide synthesis family protein
MLKIKDSIEKLSYNIISLNSQKPHQNIMITGCHRKEGSSTVSFHLARQLAQINRYSVLLIDANLKYPSLHQFLKTENKNGLTDFYLGKCSGSQIIKSTHISNLSFISSGASEYVSLGKMFTSKDILKFWESQQLEYDFIIFDTPAFSIFPDAYTLAPLVQGVLLVVHSEKTRREVAVQTKQQLEMANANLIGVALNRRKYVIPRFLYKRLK